MGETEKALNFVEKSMKGLEAGGSKEFECPICGGKAKACRSGYNGHLWAKCPQCGMQVIE